MSGRLYKLKHYCSLCQKQLKDDNGFRCHLKSESHKQMMETFMTNPEKLMDTFSKEFENAFLDILNTRHPKTAVLANTVYQELIKDQFHVHMNSTTINCRWSTLSDFVKYLEKSQICEVDWNDTKPIIKFIDKAGKEVIRETEEQKRTNKRLKESEREEREFRKLGELADREKAKAEKEAAKLTAQKTEAENLDKEEVKEEQNEEDNDKTDNNGNQSSFSGFQFKLNLSLSQAQKAAKTEASPNNADNNPLGSVKQPTQNDQTQNKKEHKDTSKPKSNIDLLLKMVDQNEKYKKNSKYDEKYKRQKISENQEKEVKANIEEKCVDEPWLCNGIIVKILQKSLGGGLFYKNPGRVYKIVSNKESTPNPEFGYQGNIKMLDGPGKGTKISIDQAYLAPIIPTLNADSLKPEVLIIKGKYKGKLALLTEVNSTDNTGILQLKDEQNDMLKLEYDCFAEYQSKNK